MNDHKYSEKVRFEQDCHSGEQVMAYLYRELAPAEISEFEEHLSHCQTCIDELADLALPRFEVLDWKRFEFDPLPTPNFAFNYAPVATISVTNRLWDRVGAIFAGFGVRNWSFAAAAVICLIAIWIAVADRSPLSDSMSANLVEKESAEVLVPDIGTQPVAAYPQEENPSGTRNEVIAKNGKLPTVVETTRKASRPQANRPRLSLQAAGNIPSGKAERYAADLEIPLTVRAEQKDESIRLTDLFEDLGGV